VKRKFKTGIRSDERPSETENIDYRYAAIGKYFFAFRGKRREGRRKRLTLNAEFLTLNQKSARSGSCSGVAISAGVLRFGSHRQPLQTRAAARFVTWEGSSSSHDPRFSREAASHGRIAVSAVQAHGGVRSSMWLRHECLSRSRRPCSPLSRCRAIAVAASL
jgi:hypothetical protein